MKNMKVVVVGGGLGGLCLAQGLKKAGIEVGVYERDQTRNERLQGYRIHIEETGNQALHDCLPAPLFEKYLKTSGDAGQGLMMRDERLHTLAAFAVDPAKQIEAVTSSRSVSRITLRQVLLDGLGDTVYYNKAFSHYKENSNGTVTAFFEDGTSVTADLLVAADGSNSRIRQQFLPAAPRKETGSVAIMGKVPLTPEVQTLLESNKLDWATIVFGPKGRGYFSAVHNLGEKAAERTDGNIGSNEAALLAEAPTLFENTSDYYFWALVTREKNYPQEVKLVQLPGKELLEITRSMVEEWHPTVRQLVEMSAPDSVIATPLRIATHVKPWSSQSITFVGDAIHSMPPTRGIGGNIALKDASYLCQKLVEVARQNRPLGEALDEYTKEMLDYSFKAVRASKQSLDLLVMENPIGRLVVRSLFKLVSLFSTSKSKAGPTRKSATAGSSQKNNAVQY